MKVLRRGLLAAHLFNLSGAGVEYAPMLGKPSRLAIPGLFLSFFVAAPAAAQSAHGSTGNAASGCRLEASLEPGTIARLNARSGQFCNVPGGIALLGGRLVRAIMFVDLTPDLAEAPRRASAPNDSAGDPSWRPAALAERPRPPVFATPVVPR
jgi:hypothetical protein